LGSARPRPMAAGPQPKPPGILFKTDLCWTWQKSGTCRSGDACNWAHGESELLPRPAWATFSERPGQTARQAHFAAQQGTQTVVEAPLKPVPEQQCSAVRKVILGEEVAEKLRLLNSEAPIAAPIDVDAVVGPLSQLDPEEALEILESLHERGRQIDDPTAWICEAAGAIPPKRNLFDEDEEPEAEEPKKEDEDVQEVEDLEDTVDPALLGLEEPGRPAKRRKQEGAEAPSAPGQPPKAYPSGLRPQQPQLPPPGKAAGKGGLVRPVGPAGPAAAWRPPARTWPATGPLQPRPPVVPRIVGPPATTWRSPNGTVYGKGAVRPARPPLALFTGFTDPMMARPGEELSMDQICNYKTRLCFKFAYGQCVAGEDCLLAHGKDELRQPWKFPNEQEEAEVDEEAEDDEALDEMGPAEEELPEGEEAAAAGAPAAVPAPQEAAPAPEVGALV